MDISEEDTFVHLIQLFLAAHPQYQADNEGIRQQEGLPQGYFVSVPMAQELARWARDKHLITRKAADRLVTCAEGLLLQTDPGATITLTQRMLGKPARLQPTILNTDIDRWLTFGEPVQERVEAWGLPMAIAVLDTMLRDPEPMDGLLTERVRLLLTWLQEQQQAWEAKEGPPRNPFMDL
jgi:hypothetical protein